MYSMLLIVCQSQSKTDDCSFALSKPETQVGAKSLGLETLALVLCVSTSQLCNFTQKKLSTAGWNTETLANSIYSLKWTPCDVLSLFDVELPTLRWRYWPLWMTAMTLIQRPFPMSQFWLLLELTERMTRSHTLTHTYSILTAIFPGEPGLAGCPLNSPSPFIPGLRILLGQA